VLFSEIAERTKILAWQQRQEGRDGLANAILEAAHEIERLRAALTNIASGKHTAGTCVEIANLALKGDRA
jgi:hemoglobin-like flavoprotein